MKVFQISGVNDIIYSYLNTQDIGALYNVSSSYRIIISNILLNDKRIMTYCSKYTCLCNICDKLYSNPIKLKPTVHKNGSITLNCIWIK